MTDSPASRSRSRAGRHRAAGGPRRAAARPWFRRKRVLVPVGVAVVAVAVSVLGDGFLPDGAPSAASTTQRSATSTAPGATPTASGTPAPSSSAPSGTASGTPAPTAAAPGTKAVSVAGTGTYRVGRTIAPGLYRSQGNGSWERLKDTTGEVDSVIAGGDSAGVEYVQVLNTDHSFATRGMADWVLVDPKSAGPRATTFAGDGTYLVGVDIAPGTYTSTGTGFWKRLSSATGDYADILANDNATGKTVVEIEKTDRFFATRGMGTWTLVP